MSLNHLSQNWGQVHIVNAIVVAGDETEAGGVAKPVVRYVDMAIAQRFSNRAIAELERQNMRGDAHEAYLVGIENGAVVNLILVRIVGGDSSKWMCGELAVPLREEGGPVICFGAEDLVGIFLFLLHQFCPFRGVLHCGAE